MKEIVVKLRYKKQKAVFKGHKEMHKDLKKIKKIK